MRVLIYIYDKSPRTLTLLRALKDGFIANKDQVDIAKVDEFKEVSDWAQMVVLLDMQNIQIANAYRRASRHVLLVERGYFYPDNYYRFALDGYQPKNLHTDPKSYARAEKIIADGNIMLDPVRPPLTKTPENIVYFGNSFVYRQWHKLRENFDVNMTRHIASKVDQENTVLWFRPDKYPANDAYPPCCYRVTPKEDVAKLIRECELLVEHGGFWGVEGLLAGVALASTSVNSPVATLAPLFPEGITSPFSYTDKERWQVLANLAHYQFSLEEIASGYAMRHLTPDTFKRIEIDYADSTPDNSDYLIAQYRLMHEMGKYRGGFNDNLMENIKPLFERFKPETLLDYGSGKGRQYSELNQHLEWHGEVKPTCYDPGHEPFATKPEGTFDGVICTDVAEHIPEHAVKEFLQTVINYATKCVFLCIYTQLAVKSLPDGRNAHLTVQHAKWWAKRIVEAMEARFGDGLVNIRNNDNHTWIISNLDGTFEVLAVFRGDESKD